MYMAQTNYDGNNYDGNITAFGRSVEHAYHTLWCGFKKRYMRSDDDREIVFYNFKYILQNGEVSVIQIADGNCIQDNEHIYPYSCDKIIHFSDKEINKILEDLCY